MLSREILAAGVIASVNAALPCGKATNSSDTSSAPTLGRSEIHLADSRNRCLTSRWSLASLP